ncbi:MAG: sulfotransferase [Okeania sp. SIO2G4]|uniref:sulfotransferase family protein n=1 Tax=unclassified Okeania TaxID=2634635 RepID=UPI0013BCC667|nr:MULTISPECIES: sulfotransferase [unclassified Okeania]NEP04440.1 sulfotransferase [Okeania sp. SIO4D6]NEP38355.1 sulfotransferase [Okeania sp. SIO2H7]NEP70691.1 sulfotransferase [Okeania sp. SIO2G5]NEP91936.1 sulfotransferase [Okeania sp. SIO2F5]NEQ89359.1 sulfotransferase [Okeania sp. SIO2G4]
MVYRKLFVVGCPRSGTSWLKRMIGSHSDVLTVPNESHAYSITYNNFTYLKNQELKKRLRSAKWIWMSYGLKPLLFGIESEYLWQGIFKQYKIFQKSNEKLGLHNLVSYTELKELIAKVSSGSEDDLIKVRTLNQLMFDRFFEKNGGTQKDILLEKTPQHLRYIDVILRQFPEAKSIEIIRDGRDVCVSYQARAKTKRWAKQSTITVAKIWKKAIETREKAKADLEISDRIYSVRYENLRTESARRTEQNFLFYWFRLRSSFN